MTEQLIYAVLLLQVLDVASTLYAFRNGAVEANPVMRKLMDALGTVPGLLLPKAIYGGAVWYFRDQFASWALAVVCVFYVAIVANNLRVARGK